MSAARVIPAKIARVVAQRIVDELRSVCDRIEVVGSLRRGKDTVHDIDIVLLPKQTPQGFTLGDCCSLDSLLRRLIERGSLTPIRGKDKIKIFVATKTGIPVDIYIATPETWATLLLIRTGSKEHNIKLAQRARELGMKLRASGDGIENANGELLRVNREEEVFSLLRLRYIGPEERD